MQPADVEAAAYENAPVLNTGGLDESKGLVITLVTLLGTGFTALLGWVIKNKLSGQRLEDAANDLTVETLTSSRARIAELENRVFELLNEVVTITRAQIAAERAASAAAGKAEHAAALAQSARRDADRAMSLLNAQTAYTSQLKALMLQAGLTLPPEPET